MTYSDRNSGVREQDYLGKIPRRTNECWMARIDGCDSVYVYGYKFLAQLEGTALRIWMLIDGKRNVNDIVGTLSAEYEDSEKNNIMDETIEFINTLETYGLASWHARPLFEDVMLDG